MNNDSDSLVEINLTDLDKLYVVTKQFAGKKYFLRRMRGGGYKCDQKFAKGCKIFDDYNEAKQAADYINQHKQKVKLKVETASTYFCNKLVYQYNRYTWNCKPFEVKNAMVPIEKFQEHLKGAKKYSLEQKQLFLAEYRKKLQELKTMENKIRQDYKIEIEEAKKRLEKRLEQREVDAIKCKKAIDDVEQFNYDDFVAQVETEQDKKYKILFGEIEL